MTRRVPIDVSCLEKLLTIDLASPTGLRWIKKPAKYSPIHIGSPAGSIGSEGYYRIGLNGTTYLNHRIVWALANGKDPGHHQIDHMDGNRANNDPSNLRLATHRTNSQNKINRSRHGVGVKYHDGSYQARIRVNGHLMHLGSFRTPEEASSAYEAAAKHAPSLLPIPTQENADD